MTEARLAALELAAGQAPKPNAIERVAKATDPESSRWAFTQWDLRARAKSKFALADKMLFTREALEQATHEKVAEYRASRFPKLEIVADLTCGIGADLIALARRGPAIGFELDSERLEYAGWNLAVHGLKADLRLADSLSADWDFDFAVADPARREGGRRTLDPEAFAPNPVRLAERMRKLQLASLKLSPLLKDEFLDGIGGEVEFWSFGDECREAAIWLGSKAGSGRRAVHLESGERLESALPPLVGEPKAYLYEADPAAIRAHSLGKLAQIFEMDALGDSNGYLTANVPIESHWLNSYRVAEALPNDRQAVKRRLRELGLGTPVVKSRSKSATAEDLAKTWRGKGASAIVAAYDVGRSVRFLLLERM